MLAKQIENTSDRYWITSVGDVYGPRGKRKPHESHNGYRYVGYKDDDGKRKQMKVSRLVALAFIPNPENKKTVDHINHDRHDDNIMNLRWATYKEQIANQRKNLTLEQKTPERRRKARQRAMEVSL